MPTLHLATLRTLMLFVSATAALTGCSITSTPTPTPPPAPDMVENATGYWETVLGRIELAEYPGKIYYYDWYAIETTADGRARVRWDNGLNCTTTDGRVQGNEIRLVAADVESVFVIHDAKHATVTFRRGLQTYIKHLEKTRDDPKVICA